MKKKNKKKLENRTKRKEGTEGHSFGHNRHDRSIFIIDLGSMIIPGSGHGSGYILTLDGGDILRRCWGRTLLDRGAAKSDSAPPRGAAWEPGHELARGQSQRRDAAICRDGVSVAFSHWLHCPSRVAHENLESGGRETWSPASGDGGTDIFNSRHGLASLTSTGTNFGVPTCMCFDQRVWHMAIPCPPSARPRLLPDPFLPKHRTSLLQEMQRETLTWQGVDRENPKMLNRLLEYLMVTKKT